MKKSEKRIVMLTAYDALMASIIDDSGVDIILIGDSLGMVVQGRDSTLSVSVDDIIYHTKAVARGTQRAHIVADMPFLSYQVSVEEGVRNAGRLVQEGGAHAVKVEGSSAMVKTIVTHLSDIGIPVMGHIGLQPQSIHAVGGYRVQGRSRKQADVLVQQAEELEQAGVYSLVLEAIPCELSKRITESIRIPTIGIGAGPYCDGQVLVTHDLLGLDRRFAPKFVKRYADLAGQIDAAVTAFVKDVREGGFPNEAYSFSQTSSSEDASP